ncbi:helicase-exonuclease AddAB subunit AddB [Clostridium felsineum]|uniref:ATP-dependent helicase/deoxyribonuclease subunit B n=1 Tax=Clostridium felsineum TaxID=36839 RepID=A0A1S8MI03_9CLOT|nr:helicase-exonuclease AddAB subunit AddB [Clostridium felsineum]URZ07129.1 ATP-dependent helicase/deoxyribonuclease subunit B [Clostridium felsineum]URZ12159.1 ATP-dependent helicase/deoxyribonuclease subunit B [Clostridium felsineum]
MSLRFIYGRAGSGKSQFCISSIKNRIEKGGDRPLILIVPEQFSFQSEKSILDLIGEKSINRVKVISFKRLAYRVFDEVGGIAREYMNSSGKSMLFYHIMNNLKSEFKVFGLSARQKGFVNTISDTISEFKKYELTTDLLRETIDNVEDEELKNKLHDLSLIYDEFNRLLYKNYIDPDDDLTILKEKIKYSEMLSGAEIWLDEFSSFIPQQYGVLEELLKRCTRVNIALTMEYESIPMDDDIFSVTKNTERRMIKIAQDNNVSIDKPVNLNKRPFYRFKNSYELGMIEKNLYSFPYEIYKDKPKKIQIFKTSNLYTEVEDIARNIIKFVREDNVRFSDIAVVTGNLEGYEKTVAVIFKEYGIPFFIDKNKDIEDNTLIILIRSIMDIFIKNWSYETVFRYLKTGFVDIDIDEIDILENYVLAAGIKGKKKWTDKWTYDVYSDSLSGEISEENKEKIEKVNEIKDKFLKPLLDFRKKVLRKNNVTEICTALFEFLHDINVPVAVEKMVDEFRKNGRQILANEYSQIWNILMELMDQLVEVMGNEKVNLEQFSRILFIGIKEHKMGLIPSSLDQVLVGSIDRLKSHAIRFLYIMGVNDGVFPSAAMEEGILSDRDREVLMSKGVELAKDTKTQAMEQRFLVYTAITNSSEYLFLSYPIADYEGKTLRPSLIINRIKTLFPKIIEKSDVIKAENDEEDMKLISSTVPTFNEMISSFRKEIDEEDKISSIWHDVYRWYAKNEKWAEKCESMFKAIAYTNQVDYISKEKALKLYGGSLKMSVSRLEKYIECPFSYYVQYGLKIKDRKIFTLTPPDLGSFMHKVIDKFCENIKDENIDWKDVNEDICEQKIYKIVDQEVEGRGGSILNSSPRYSYITSRLKRILKRTATIVAEQFRRGSFRPVGYEVAFENGGNYPPIKVILDDNTEVILTGRIDRIDMLEKDGNTYIRIVDYKSGNKIFKLSDVYYGFDIQLLLYLNAILENENVDEDDRFLPGAILYFTMDDPIVKGKENLTDNQIKDEIMKSLKMKGLLISDPEVVKEMDREMEGSSLIIPASIKKDGTLGRSSAATKQQFEMLIKHVRNLVVKNCEKLLMGDIKIRPYKKGKDKPCDYCTYSSICRFDTIFDGDTYRYVKEKSDEEVWKLVDIEVEEEGDKDGKN